MGDPNWGKGGTLPEFQRIYCGCWGGGRLDDISDEVVLLDGSFRSVDARVEAPRRHFAIEGYATFWVVKKSFFERVSWAKGGNIESLVMKSTYTRRPNSSLVFLKKRHTIAFQIEQCGGTSRDYSRCASIEL